MLVGRTTTLMASQASANSSKLENDGSRNLRKLQASSSGSRTPTSSHPSKESQPGRCYPSNLPATPHLIPLVISYPFRFIVDTRVMITTGLPDLPLIEILGKLFEEEPRRRPAKLDTGYENQAGSLFEQASAVDP